ALGVDSFHPGDSVIGTFDEIRYTHIIDEYSAQVGGCLSDVDGEPGIIELSIVVEHAAFQSFFSDIWKEFFNGLSPKQRRFGKAVAESHPIIDLQSDTVEKFAPPSVVRNDEGLHVDNVGGIFQKDA